MDTAFLVSAILGATLLACELAAGMLGFGGHFLTKSRRYSVTFRILRDRRVIYRRTQPLPGDDTRPPAEDTTLVVNFLRFVGSGWHTAGDALLANTAAAMARERLSAL